MAAHPTLLILGLAFIRKWSITPELIQGCTAPCLSTTLTMNAYPAELLGQLAPVMFIAGLDEQAPASPTPAKSQDPFAVLVARLRDSLQPQLRPSIWASERTKSFHVVLVEKNVRFPPRKLVSPEDPSYPSAHSPLSPLSPSSPLHPDGLIAPIWIRKHTAFLPSVFVLFLRMFEASGAPLTPRSPLDQPDPDHDRTRVEEERKSDTELSAEIAQRKKATTERGIKLTVVLLASRRMLGASPIHFSLPTSRPLDDSSLDGRLSFIRRQSGLDSRAALFVLSPVSPAELDEFLRRSVGTLVIAPSLLIRSACKTRSTSPPWSTTLPTRNESVESVIDTPRHRPIIHHLSYPSAPLVPAHSAQRAGQSDMNTRWHALQNSGAKTKWRSSASKTYIVYVYVL